MVVRRRRSDEEEPARPRPATTPEAREAQLIAAAVELAERQILAGTASSQVITHYLKLGTTREKLEQERLRQEVELTRMKTEAIASQARIEELYTNALNAMRSYQGQGSPEEENFYPGREYD